jgi:hypothetical protein
MTIPMGEIRNGCKILRRNLEKESKAVPGI